jgi:hypothetical protein
MIPIDFGAVNFGLSGFGVVTTVEESITTVGASVPALPPGVIVGAGNEQNLNIITIRNLTRFSFTLGRKPQPRKLPLPVLVLPPKGSVMVDSNTIDLGQIDALRRRSYIEVM